MRRKGMIGAACAGGLAVLMVACTASPPIPYALTPQPSPPVTSAPTSTHEPLPDVGPAADPGPCEGAVSAYPLADETAVEQLGGATLAVPLDRGPMPHATGETVLNDQGVPVAYTVAENDVISVIGARFCVGEQWLSWVNHVRRDGDALFVGDTLNLDAHTIFSVGDQNGVVHDNAFPEGFVIPPQR